MLAAAFQKFAMLKMILFLYQPLMAHENALPFLWSLSAENAGMLREQEATKTKMASPVPSLDMLVRVPKCDTSFDESGQCR